jgi:hypothetical protein
MDSIQRFVNVPPGKPLDAENKVLQREPVSSSDVYIEPAPSMGSQQEAFTAELCINGVAVDASIQGRLIV